MTPDNKDDGAITARATALAGNTEVDIPEGPWTTEIQNASRLLWVALMDSDVAKANAGQCCFDGQ